MKQPRVPARVKAFLRRYARYLVLGHEEPDGDTVASQLVMAALLSRLGKEALPYSAGPFDRPEIAPFADRFLSGSPEPEVLGGQAAAVVLDCSTADRLGSLEGSVTGLPVLVIDHHAAGEEFGDLRWIVPEAPAVAYLVQLLMEDLQVKPSGDEAELLLFGLARDTGYFRHLGESSGPVFDAVARLVAAGASPRRVYEVMHSGWELAKIRLLALSLERAEPALEGQVLITWLSRDDLAAAAVGSSPAGGATRGSDETYRLLQAVSGVEVVAFLQEEPDGSCTVGLRSSRVVDVGRLARSLGGGGHVRAAGYTRRLGLAEARVELLGALAPLLHRRC